MDMFNYVMVLASVIVGLGVTHLLQGIVGIVQHPGRERVYWIHLAWAAATFLRAVFWWWFEFRLSETKEWTFTLYGFVLTYAFLIYLWCALLFPRDLAGYDGYRDYFYSRKAWFFAVGIAGVAVDVVDTLLKGVAHFQSLGVIYPVAMSVLAILFMIAILTRNERYHGALAIFSILYLVIYPLTNLQTVQ
jgi:hypothetical protein